VPFTKITTPSSARVVTVTSESAEASGTSNLVRNCALTPRFEVGAGTSMFVVTGPPKPSTGAPVRQAESSNCREVHPAGHAVRSKRQRHTVAGPTS
jgi:hypothetical protein